MLRLALLLLWCALALNAAGIEEMAIPTVQDLTVEASQFASHHTPMLLMVYADNCVYCMRMEDEFLKPMMKSGAYAEKVLIRRIPMDDAYTLKDFNGKQITGTAFAARYQVTLTPTLLFLDRNGAQLTEKMVGLTTPDYFGSYLDASIDAAVAAIRRE